jgi:dipeptidyl-peptidase-4
MKKKILFAIFTIFLSISSVFAQNKQLTLEDAVWNQWFSLRPKTLTQLQWIANSHDYVYVKDWKNLVKGSINKEPEKTILTVDEVNKALTAAKLPQIKFFYNIEWLNKQKFYQVVDSLVYIFDVSNKKLVQSFLLPGKAKNVHYNSIANAVAFTIDNNLLLEDAKGKITKISNEPNKNIIYGGNYVHRQEFGIDNGIFWSPDGKYIAFYRKDQTMVADYPLIDYTKFPAKVKLIKYPMTGQTSEQVTLGVYNLATKKIVYMKTGLPKDHFLTSVTWDPTSNFIYIGILNRDQNHLWFNKYSRSTGKMLKTLFEEQNPKYVEPLHPAYFLPKTKNEFLWTSERDGYFHLYLYNTNGKLIRQIDNGPWVVTKYYGVSPDEKYMYIQSTAVCALQRHIYKVNMKNGKMDMLTKTQGFHNAKFSSDFKYFINDFSAVDIPHVINIKNNKGKTIKPLLNAENPLAEYKLGHLKLGTIKAADGKTNLYYRLITPPNMDSTKKYPVIVYVYGGPHAQLITDSWLSGVRLWQFYMAQKGYVMFTLDNRGSYNRGFDFESVIFRHLGVNEMKDQLEGVKFLKSLPFVDSTRMGVHGWSFGGFMTTSLMTTYPNVFKVAVAGGPVTDWKYYEVMYGERYMDTPQTNPEGYKQTSVINKIQNLKGKLMIIHGGVDPVVVPQNTRALLLKAQKLGIDIQFYEFPNSEHNVRGHERVLLMKKITDYFDENL